MADEIKQKIVVFGAFGAGKTTMIKTIDPKSTHIEANCAGGTTTVALDFGRVELDGRQIHIYGTPGQERFEFAREIIGKGMDGAVLLVDAGSPLDEFTRHLYDSLTAANVPFVVFLNKCDAKAPVPAVFASAFGTVPVWTVSALDKKQCFGAIRRFTETLPVRTNGSGKR
ncbi:MAG: GTP-binding protein [Methanoregula sp.]|jgi:small GTP-binding protein|uniref:GTP-binding protein n=1 Tax=Methanoregula sp. TaxID=2052170 RepID=UPI003C15E90B